MHEIGKREIYDQSHSFDAGAPSKQSRLPPADGVRTITRGAATPIHDPTDASSDQPGPIIQQNERPGVEDVYLHFDSYYRDSSALSNGEITFSISSLNNNYPISDITHMTITSFYFPLIENATGEPDYYFYRKLYLQLANIATTQSVLSYQSNQFHFEFDIDNLSSVAVKVTPLNPTFYFQRPIQSLESITFRFMVDHGFRRVPLPNDTLSVVGVGGTNPAQFRVTSTDGTTPLGDVGVPVAPGIAIYIIGMTTGDAGVNNATNTAAGVFVTNIISSTVFVVGSLDFSTLPAGDYPATIRIPKNHIGFSIRFTCAKTYPTNYTEAVHV